MRGALIPISTEAEMREFEEKCFRAWMREVDRAIGRLAGGLTSSDLADWHYRDAYDDGETPKRAAVEALKAEGM